MELLFILALLFIVLLSLAVSADTRARKAERLAQQHAARLSHLERHILPKGDHWRNGR
ncbi:hypothetical protein [Deinococcus peraridilitoris]|uniref:Uncharacterized protein n=1 Tax=Deinococcus peraridilitoris (strain DSM 19664 / LMG 22246 / CIP 109416 / KR-200) TaxID=937777 RepID=K9ZWS1_DEIPD|nr:hypothetical protein [Deinococcus peraridilitoris]AFZ66088.1 hypothetical protein Deipe_0492 [Deinococcus peraridilitoris DSM 19664]